MSCVSLDPTEKECNAILELGFIIDSSGSIGRSSWREVKRFLVYLARRLTVSAGRTHIGALTFDTGARLEFCFNDGEEINAVEDKFQTIKEPSGYTYTDEALKLANEQLFSSSCGMRENAAKVCTFSDNAVLFIPRTEIKQYNTSFHVFVLLYKHAGCWKNTRKSFSSVLTTSQVFI